LTKGPFAGDLERLGHLTRVRNGGLGITGCLFHFGSHFIQVLEGGRDEVGTLFGTLVSADRIEGVIGLVDHMTVARSYPDWSARWLDGPARPPARWTTTPFDAADEIARPRAPTPAKAISGHLRNVPQQARAVKTVDRLLDATAAMVERERRLEALSLEAIATRAGVTQQSAYRYFANVDDLIRTMVRRAQAHWYERFAAFMTRGTLESDSDLAEDAVAFVASTYGGHLPTSAGLKHAVLRRYHNIDYDAAWALALEICGAKAQIGAARIRTGAGEVAAGIVAVWAVAKSLALRDADLGLPAIRDMLTNIFLAALAAPRNEGSGGPGRRT
jgi:AcrR family transcriptional regulator